MSTKRFLLEIIKESSFPMRPQKTGLDPVLSSMPEIKTVVFDVYGTLFISASGDISLAQQEDRESIMRNTLMDYRLTLLDTGTSVTETYYDIISAAQQRRRDEGIEFPEVDAVEVWTTLLNRLQSEGRISGSITPEIVTRIATDYECRVNPVCPMPGAQEVIEEIKARGIRLGIVSNAQFYTPLLFEAFFVDSVEDMGFNLDLSAWSWIELEAKPSVRLFKKVRDAADNFGISAHEILYVGNDMRNDIVTSQKAGFKTALFAGDKRSLRLREDDPACAAAKPDLILTDLEQLTEVVLRK